MILQWFNVCCCRCCFFACDSIQNNTYRRHPTHARAQHWNTNSIGQQLFHIHFTFLSSSNTKSIHNKLSARSISFVNFSFVSIVLAFTRAVFTLIYTMCCTLLSRLWLSYPSTDWSHQQQKQQQRRNSDIRLNIHKNFTLDTCWWLFPVYFLFCLSFFPFYSSSLSSPDHIEWPWFVCVYKHSQFCEPTTRKMTASWYRYGMISANACDFCVCPHSEM